LVAVPRRITESGSPANETAYGGTYTFKCDSLLALDPRASQHCEWGHTVAKPTKTQRPGRHRYAT